MDVLVELEPAGGRSSASTSFTGTSVSRRCSPRQSALAGDKLEDVVVAEVADGRGFSIPTGFDAVGEFLHALVRGSLVERPT